MKLSELKDEYWNLDYTYTKLRHKLSHALDSNEEEGEIIEAMAALSQWFESEEFERYRELDLIFNQFVHLKS